MRRLSDAKRRALRAGEGRWLVSPHGLTYFVSGSPDDGQCFQHITLASLARAGLMRIRLDSMTLRPEYTTGPLGRQALDDDEFDMRKPENRPPPFTEGDELALCALALKIYQDVQPDLGTCYISDFLDVMDSQVHLRGPFVDLDELMVARDAEMQQNLKLGRELRAGRMPLDLMIAFRGRGAGSVASRAHHAWARTIVKQFMQKHADRRGLLKP